MNNQERILAFIMGLALVAWVFYNTQQAKQRAEAAALNAPQEQVTASEQVSVEAVAPVAISEKEVAGVGADYIEHQGAEELITLNGDALTLTLSSHGAVIREATLNEYLMKPGKATDDNPPVSLDFALAPVMELWGVPGVAANAAFEVEAQSDGRRVTFMTTAANGLQLQRSYELLDEYQVKVRDTWVNTGAAPLALLTNTVSMGVIQRGSSRNDILSIDSLPVAENAKPQHWDKHARTKQYLAGSRAGGCAGKRPETGMPARITIPITTPQNWVAIKSRFFMSGFMSDSINKGFIATMIRDASQSNYVLDQVAVRVIYDSAVLEQGATLTRDYTLYLGPKRLSLLQKLGSGMDSVMQFGVFTWFCKLLVITLNFFYRLIPNYGIAIILLTFLVRIIFWPLTHKSTVSMRKMQGIQPELKKLQEQFKDNPQKLQQETWTLYRQHKVNPMSSCLPMLIQIPVFIALFNVLRSAVELRYAPFLWVLDLSEPENLFAGFLPIPLNILPILMTATMALQSYLTPATGDAQQQRMMMIMMPVMMLFMFYSFPAALALYWMVSQVLSIIQMLMIRRGAQRAEAGGGTGVANPPLTRQQRRHGA